MKIVTTFFSILLFAFSCNSQNKKNYPTLTLSDNYNQIQVQGSNTIPQNFELNATKGFILDCSNYNFSMIKSMNENKLPDVINILSKSGNFSIKLNANGKTIIDNSTMQSIDGADKKFTEFIKGDTAMLSIGTIKNNEMMSYWLGLINIK